MIVFLVQCFNFFDDFFSIVYIFLNKLVPPLKFCYTKTCRPLLAKYYSKNLLHKRFTSHNICTYFLFLIIRYLRTSSPKLLYYLGLNNYVLYSIVFVSRDKNITLYYLVCGRGRGTGQKYEDSSVRACNVTIHTKC